MNKETGGPAFPTQNEHQTGNQTWHFEGMTMRDYFAGQALIACRNHSNEKWLAERSYKIADAMLKARES